ncbi:putative phage tail assembly chaperone [Aeromonas veronii]|uniref:putative phage tail assembly chaperone n=1 Tax=Aeromonas TaxID=642 RepID=UPI0022EAABBF|nr:MULTISPECIES: putative phage tail assembly chaperone [Aeromonas]KAJ8740044.1 putative phage tail assembly chaperone [Aeromonas veronii]MDA3317862.1 putative phage tail assembly chaperone [Aeromonas sp. PI_26]
MSKITPITLTIAGTDITFHPTMTAYNSYINGLSMTDKIAPSHQYLKRIISPESKEALEALLARPGAALQIAAKVNELYAPDLDIEVKN